MFNKMSNSTKLIIFFNTRNKNKKHYKKGFTLLELLTVIAIISILAAAFVPKITGYIDEARKVAVLNQAKDVVIAFQNAKLKNQSLDSTETNIDDLPTYTTLISLDEIDKIEHTRSIEDCINILDTEKYNFNLTDGKLDSITEISY